MTKIIYGDTIEVEPSLDRPVRGMLLTVCYIDAVRDNTGIMSEDASRLAGLAADLILRDYDLQTNVDINLIGE